MDNTQVAVKELSPVQQKIVEIQYQIDLHRTLFFEFSSSDCDDQALQHDRQVRNLMDDLNYWKGLAKQ